MSGTSAKAIILKTGPGSSVQDLGRKGMAKFGVPLAGAMDQRSMRWINHQLQNVENAAVLEISQPGFSIQFNSPTGIGLAGAVTDVKLNGMEIQNTACLAIRSGDRLEIGAFSLGARVYLGIRHGFQTPSVLGSRSFYPELTEVSHLVRGSEIGYIPDSSSLSSQNAKAKWSPDWYLREVIPAYPGPDFDLLNEELREKLIEKPFRISGLANRMGAQLLELLENKLPELPTNPVFPGTVQLTSGGKLVILLKDAQVTGGYPRILYLNEEAQWIVAQKKSGDQLRFRLVNL